LVGLGRLDKILDWFANEKDYEETVCVLIEFIVELHRYYNYKSASIKGDIGQIIILGGKESDGTYFSNNLTYEFIEAIKRAGVPDPKCLLRVSEVMPQELLKNAVDCIATGIGSPLLSNDDVVVPALIEFGYDIEDAYNYVTSACWEPVSYGNSLEQNNLGNIKFADAFVEMLKDDKIVECKEYKELFEIYLIHLEKEINNLKENISLIEWENEPLYTLFTEGCKDNDKDLSQGGAKYNDYGVLSIGLANTVNSLINIEKLVFEDKKWSISEVHKAWIDNNVEVMSQISIDSASMKKTFGHDSSASIEIVNRIIDFTKGEFSNYKNKFGGRVKFGLSSPAYINGAVSTGYTVDGRKAGEPVSVHISSDDSVAYTELISFASKLHYNGCSSNGNVVDFFVTPSFINDNKEKFVQFVYLGIKSGFFQTQMNVVGSETLIAAKNNPEAYKNLIVRVWGFSAYFNDLPEDYKEVLIKRALINEGFDYDNNKYTKIFVT
jgi:formate C-acetyltransferase